MFMKLQSAKILQRGVAVNDKQIKQKVNDVMYAMMKEKGVIAPVDVLMEVGVLSKTDYEAWRRGGVPFLEKVCKVNLRKLSTINREMRAFAKKNNLKSSWTYYKQWSNGKPKVKKGGQGKPATPPKLRFSKSGDENIEKQYATHFISHTTLGEIKKRRQQAEASDFDAVDAAE